MNDELFPLADSRNWPGVTERNFPFCGITTAELFKRSTGLEIVEIAEKLIWKTGFSGSLDARRTLSVKLQNLILQRFIGDEEFACALSVSDDKLGELSRLAKRLLP